MSPRSFHAIPPTPSAAAPKCSAACLARWTLSAGAMCSLKCVSTTASAAEHSAAALFACAACPIAPVASASRARSASSTSPEPSLYLVYADGTRLHAMYAITRNMIIAGFIPNRAGRRGERRRPHIQPLWNCAQATTVTSASASHGVEYVNATSATLRP